MNVVKYAEEGERHFYHTIIQARQPNFSVFTTVLILILIK
jgi:hypothetical protein